MNNLNLTLFENDSKVIEAFKNYFSRLGIETCSVSNCRGVLDTCLTIEPKCVIISGKHCDMSNEEFVNFIQIRRNVHVLLIEEGPTLKITRYKNGETPSSIHCSNRLKKTDAETWKVIWDEIQKMIT